MERALFGGSTGAIYALLRRASLTTCPLSLRKSSVPDLVSQEEYTQIKSELESSLPPESRVKQVTLIARNVAVTAALALGRGHRTEQFLRALRRPLPRQWELQNEIEAAAAAEEVDLAAEQELEEEVEWEAPLAAELVHTAVRYEVTEAEEDIVKRNYKLSNVPRELQAQLDAYRDWRLAPLCYARSGNAVVDTLSPTITASRYGSSPSARRRRSCHRPSPSSAWPACQTSCKSGWTTRWSAVSCGRR